MIYLLPLWFGFWRRFYGSQKLWFPSYLNRILGYAFPLGLSLFLYFPLYVDLYRKSAYFILLVVAFWLGISLVKYSKYWFMKTSEDWFMMAYNGILLTAPVGLVLYCHDIWSSVVVGFSGLIALPVGYWLGWKMPLLPKYLTGGTEWGELISGILFGLSALLMYILQNRVINF